MQALQAVVLSGELGASVPPLRLDSGKLSAVDVSLTLSHMQSRTRSQSDAVGDGEWGRTSRSGFSTGRKSQASARASPIPPRFANLRVNTNIRYDGPKPPAAPQPK